LKSKKGKVEMAGLAHDELKTVMKIMGRAEKDDDLNALTNFSITKYTSYIR
jgi:hypothetical protein